MPRITPLMMMLLSVCQFGEAQAAFAGKSRVVHTVDVDLGPLVGAWSLTAADDQESPPPTIQFGFARERHCPGVLAAIVTTSDAPTVYNSNASFTGTTLEVIYGLNTGARIGIFSEKDGRWQGSVIDAKTNKRFPATLTKTSAQPPAFAFRTVHIALNGLPITQLDGASGLLLRNPNAAHVQGTVSAYDGAVESRLCYAVPATNALGYSVFETDASDPGAMVGYAGTLNGQIVDLPMLAMGGASTTQTLKSGATLSAFMAQDGLFYGADYLDLLAPTPAD